MADPTLTPDDEIDNGEHDENGQPTAEHEHDDADDEESDDDAEQDDEDEA